jgi:hypothetical protein
MATHQRTRTHSLTCRLPLAKHSPRIHNTHTTSQPTHPTRRPPHPAHHHPRPSATTCPLFAARWDGSGGSLDYDDPRLSFLGNNLEGATHRPSNCYEPHRVNPVPPLPHKTPTVLANKPASPRAHSIASRHIARATLATVVAARPPLCLGQSRNHVTGLPGVTRCCTRRSRLVFHTRVTVM